VDNYAAGVPGYSGTPLEKKLGVKDGITVFLDAAPEGFALDARTTRRPAKALELTLTFHLGAASLESRLPDLVERTVPAGAIWVCWPKKAAVKAGLIDVGEGVVLDENTVRDIGLAAGMVDVKVAAIDEVWSGLKFVRRLRDR
jgi:hypothetical protein